MSLRAAWAFLTRLPGGTHPRNDRELGRSVCWFPLVGVVIGAFSGAVYWWLHGPLGAALSASAAVAASVVVTGAFHEDGLADTADALGGVTREQRLEIMKDSRVGTFGVLALVLTVLVRVFAVSSLAPLDGLAALLLAHMLGRAMAVAAMATMPAVSGAGLGHSYTTHLCRVRTAVSVAVSCAAAAGLGVPGAAGLAVAAVATVLVLTVARRAFGGITGDVLGAVEQAGEVAVLVAAASLAETQAWTWL
ncbi:MAG: adenosylcobinamide-GDP ribazoletransferase [Acidimicrobiaceae bacterium]|nr:adenosylcobinamide-GDP ribazoletransferase [Acidimicrobiaceae bacterium]MCY4176154.1 adenosylcobinamide-GDP ribazoletransferase [Acidimicrobiaceae bacterium]MCY4280394.1 adenosylcobinamide-GDP ribazoletransferase [Acidimicrobiaceae bacterium]MCY4294357.1 adenosylcobinamide-GDP ribazoletransferase [Acidimicrobiaceae bacterium]